MNAMSRKTTVYLPAALKAAIESEARRRGISEGQVIRDAVEAALARPKPRAGFLDADPFAGRADESLVRFGER